MTIRTIRIAVFTCVALTVGMALTSSPAVTGVAQTPQGPAETVRKNFSQVSDWVMKSAELVPAEKYNYKPVDTVRTFGEQIGHIADSYNYFCAHASGNKVQWSDAIEKGKTDKATLLPKLKEATDKCNAVYPTESAQPSPLITNIAHTNLHYGNVITYIRMMGLKPPSS